MYPLDDTIAAIASPPGGAARGIVRISGPNTLACLAPLFRDEGRHTLAPVETPTALAGCLNLPDLAAPLPCDLYLWPEGRSYTGQPVAEAHTLGSQPLVEILVRALCRTGARLAEPGEFTLRAFLAGRIDLTQAEAVLGVIDATDRRELDVALTQLAGGLARPLDQLRDELLDLLAHLEAGFDFADEDLPFITPERLAAQCDKAARSVEKLTRRMTSRREGDAALRAVLIGRPNAGKSSLFNILACDAGAIVSERPGTTRDYLTAELDLDGVACRLVDTAGLESDLPLPGDAESLVLAAQAQPKAPALRAGDPESLVLAAQAVSRRQSRQAHVQLVCIESARPLGDWERSQLACATDGRRLVVITKVDLTGGDAPFAASSAIRTSSVTGEGIPLLRAALRRAVLEAAGCDAEVVAGTAARCRQSLHAAGEALDRAGRLVCHGRGEELIAAEIRLAIEELGRVVGAVCADDVLDRVFSRFCVGK
jgi:tRNA modification GTPase